MKNLKKRNLVLVLLVLFALAISGTTYAYWASGVVGDNDTATGTVTIGEGNSVQTTVTVADETDTIGNLVPTLYSNIDGVYDPINPTQTYDTVVLTFDVIWSGLGAEGTTGALAITVDSLAIIDPLLVDSGLTKTEIEAMFTVTPQTGVTATVGQTVQATVTIVFATEPATKAIYDLVANGSLVIGLTFTVTP